MSQTHRSDGFAHDPQASATRATISAVPRPIPVGAEMERLAPFFRDMTWRGTIARDGMGPGTPEMTAFGRGIHEPIHEGRWIVGNYEQDQLLRDGTFVLRWQLHWVVGWDPTNGEYRAVLADNYGHADVMRGEIEGARLTFETLGDVPVRLRLVWKIITPDDMSWRNEMSAQGAPYVLVEEYHCTPI
jgi:Protein of unknown function (DUF1579)